MTDYATMKRHFEEACFGMDVDLLESYSGRGMMGRSCLGIACDGAGDLMSIAMQIVQLVAEEDCCDLTLDDLELILSDVREDGMGRRVVYYWPKLRAPEQPK